MDGLPKHHDPDAARRAQARGQANRQPHNGASSLLEVLEEAMAVIEALPLACESVLTHSDDRRARFANHDPSSWCDAVCMKHRILAILRRLRDAALRERPASLPEARDVLVEVAKWDGT